jgi:hypothetical protein
MNPFGAQNPSHLQIFIFSKNCAVVLCRVCHASNGVLAREALKARHPAPIHYLPFASYRCACISFLSTSLGL